MSTQTLGERIIARVENPEDRARLAAMVPDPSAADGYAERILPGARTEDELYRRAMDPDGRRRAILLFGPSGSGKTLSPWMFAARHGLPVAVIEGHNGFDAEVVWQVPYQDPESGLWKGAESDALVVWRYGGMIVTDEIGRIPPKSQSAVFPLFDDRRRITLPSKEVVRMADDVVVVATTNPPSYAGVSQMDPALWDRFSPVLMWDYDPDVEAALITSGELLRMARNVRERGGEFETPLSTRQLVEFEELVSDMGWGFARAALIARYAEYEQFEIQTVLDNHGPKIAEELGVESGF